MPFLYEQEVFEDDIIDMDYEEDAMKDEELENVDSSGDAIGSVDGSGSGDGERQTKQISTYKAILVQRRNTIGFIEFMRGKYELDAPEYIIKLFNMLSFDEKRILREYESFDAIRKIFPCCVMSISSSSSDTCATPMTWPFRSEVWILMMPMPPRVWSRYSSRPVRLP